MFGEEESEAGEEGVSAGVQAIGSNRLKHVNWRVVMTAGSRGNE